MKEVESGSVGGEAFGMRGTRRVLMSRELDRYTSFEVPNYYSCNNYGLSNRVRPRGP